MSSPGPSAPKKRAQYTIRACNGCRRRRCKCDGVQPTCGTCAFYGHECSWSVDNDTSRPPTKQLVESLRVKIQVLEAEIRDLQIKHKESDAVPTSLEPSGSLGISRADPSLGGLLIPNEFRPTVHATGQYPLARWSQGQRPMDGTAPSPITQTSSSAYQYIFNIDTSTPPNQQSENILRSLSCDWSRHLPPLDEVQLSRLEHDTILDRYFNYYACWLLTLIPQLFLRDMLSSLAHDPPNPPLAPHRHYSALLHCALLAFAVALSDDPFISQRATRERFARHAKQLLEKELHHPSMTLAQSLALLSEYHRGIGEREKAYMYMGMSIRAVRAISSKGGEFSQSNPTDFAPRRNDMLHSWNFWSLCSQDKLMSLEYKSDFGLASPRTSALPPWGDLNIDQDWYNNPTLGLESGTAHNGRLTEVFGQSCKLMQIAEDIIATIHSKTRSGLTLEKEEAMNIHGKLEAWMNGLSLELLISDDLNTFAAPLPHIIALNVCYWWLLLLVHQPFYGGLPNDAQPSVDLSTQRCDHAARMTVKLINLYSYWHPLRFFPRNMMQVIFAAGSIFLQQYTQLPTNASEARANAQMGIQNCVGALRIISQTWEPAEA